MADTHLSNPDFSQESMVAVAVEQESRGCVVVAGDWRRNDTRDLRTAVFYDSQCARAVECEAVLAGRHRFCAGDEIKWDIGFDSSNLCQGWGKQNEEADDCQNS